MPLKNSKIFSEMVRLGILCTTDIKETIEERRGSGFRAYPLSEPKPKYLAKNNYLILDGIRNVVFNNLIKLISKEPEAEHLTVHEIEDNLYNFILYVLDGNEEKSKIKAKVKENIKNLLHPYVHWFVISPLDSVKTEIEINFNDENFIKKIQKNDFEKYFFNDERSKQNFDKEYLSKTAIFVSVTANNPDSVLQKGKEKINELLDLLQFNFGDNYFYSIEKPNAFLVIHKENKTGKQNWASNKKPICNIQNDKKVELEKLIKLTEEFFFPQYDLKINRNILTAIRWFADAVKSENLDDKLSKYFVSLESLLLPETLGEKGERLTYRITLLWSRIQGTFTLPDQILWLYERRSEIIHKGYSRVPLTKSNLYSIEYIVQNSILLACDIIKKNKITKLDDFISWLEVKDETKEKLNQHFIKFCSKKLKEFAESVS